MPTVAQLTFSFAPGWITWPFWATIELVYAVLNLAIAGEIALKVFGRLPGARPSVARTLAVALSLTALYVAAAPSSLSFGGAAEFVGKAVLPRLKIGIALVFAALALHAYRFNVPLDRLHRAVLVGFASYLVVFVVAMDQFRLAGAISYLWTTLIAAIGYNAVLAFWAREAWTPDVTFTRDSEAARRFWPWALRA